MRGVQREWNFYYRPTDGKKKVAPILNLSVLYNYELFFGGPPTSFGRSFVVSARTYGLHRNSSYQHEWLRARFYPGWISDLSQDLLFDARTVPSQFVAGMVAGSSAS